MTPTFREELDLPNREKFPRRARMNSIDQFVRWLENWVYSSNRKSSDTGHIVIMTIDNPGWGVTIDLANHLYNKVLPLADVMNSESDWYYCTIRDNKFEGDGGLFNLKDIFYTFNQLVNYAGKYFPSSSQKMQAKDDLTWLSQWFACQCDGDWEHRNGIKIVTTDNPGWCLKVSLYETELEKNDFQIVDTNQAEHDWLYCSVKNNVFEGFGGPFNLPELLHIFREWAES